MGRTPIRSPWRDLLEHVPLQADGAETPPPDPQQVRPFPGTQWIWCWTAQGPKVVDIHRGSLGGGEHVLGTAAQAGLLHGVDGVPQKLVCVLLVPKAEVPGDL